MYVGVRFLLDRHVHVFITNIFEQAKIAKIHTKTL